MPSPTTITVSQLSRLIGTPDCPVIIDACIDEDFNLDPYLIPGAFRYPHDQITLLATRLKDCKVVVVCQKGLKISEGAAAVLRHLGISAENLQGGNFAWRDANQPRIPAQKIPAKPGEATRWVTKQRPKIDRIACPWLIRRFIDVNAEFLFVKESQVEAVAEKFQATPFDIENTFWSHRADRCTFDTLIEEFELTTEPLLKLAEIIRGADTNRLDLTPQSSGLLAASLGLSRMYKDDLLQLQAGLQLYDAFYRWARDAMDETHDWPNVSNKASHE